MDIWTLLTRPWLLVCGSCLIIFLTPAQHWLVVAQTSCSLISSCPNARMNTGCNNGQTWVAYTCIPALGLRASIFACLPTDQALSGTLVSWPAVAGQTLTPMLQFVTASWLAGAFAPILSWSQVRRGGAKQCQVPMILINTLQMVMSSNTCHHLHCVYALAIWWRHMKLTKKKKNVLGSPHTWCIY